MDEDPEKERYIEVLRQCVQKRNYVMVSKTDIEETQVQHKNTLENQRKMYEEKLEMLSASKAEAVQYLKRVHAQKIAELQNKQQEICSMLKSIGGELQYNFKSMNNVLSTLPEIFLEKNDEEETFPEHLQLDFRKEQTDLSVNDDSDLRIIEIDIETIIVSDEETEMSLQNEEDRKDFLDDDEEKEEEEEVKVKENAQKDSKLDLRKQVFSNENQDKMLDTSELKLKIANLEQQLQEEIEIKNQIQQKLIYKEMLCANIVQEKDNIIKSLEQENQFLKEEKEKILLLNKQQFSKYDKMLQKSKSEIAVHEREVYALRSQFIPGTPPVKSTNVESSQSLAAGKKKPVPKPSTSSSGITNRKDFRSKAKKK